MHKLYRVTTDNKIPDTDIDRIEAVTRTRGMNYSSVDLCEDMIIPPTLEPNIFPR